MDFELTPEQRELQRRARRLVEEVIQPHELLCEEMNGLPPEILADMKVKILASGLHSSNIPSEYGGGGFSVLEQALLEEQLGALTNGLWDVVWRPANVLVHGTHAQREEYLRPSTQGKRRYAFAVTEAGAGSDPAAIAASAVPHKDGYLINGEKWHVTVGDVADFLIVLASVPDGAERRSPCSWSIRSFRVSGSSAPRATCTLSSSSTPSSSSRTSWCRPTRCLVRSGRVWT